jgi:hypothetical protein
VPAKKIRGSSEAARQWLELPPPSQNPSPNGRGLGARLKLRGGGFRVRRLKAKLRRAEQKIQEQRLEIETMRTSIERLEATLGKPTDKTRAPAKSRD